jgi:hypothetical protein
VAGDPLLHDRSAFAERIRIQLVSRYSGATVDVDPDRFALRVRASGIDTTLPLAPLHHAVLRDPARTPALISAFVASVESQLTRQSPAAFAPTRVLWCVRTRGYLEGIGRAGDLLVREVAADLIAFIAEELPASIMRGVPRDEWRDAGYSDDAVSAAADRQIAERFAQLARRISAVDRIPADGWRIASDVLFQSSVVVAPTVLEALTARAGGDVLLAVPDRSVALALPASLPSAVRFARRVLREWREAMNPCSHEVFVTDGSSLRALPRRKPRAAALVMPWLQE